MNGAPNSPRSFRPLILSQSEPFFATKPARELAIERRREEKMKFSFGMVPTCLGKALDITLKLAQASMAEKSAKLSFVASPTLSHTH